MIDENNIPIKWEVDRATNKEDSDLISNYILSLPDKGYWDKSYIKENYPMVYYISVYGDTYNGSRTVKNAYKHEDCKAISIEEFKKYILKLPEYQEEVVKFEESTMIINNQLLTIRGDEIIKIKNIK